MPMNFHDATNRFSYATRHADDTWLQAMPALINVGCKRVADIGCGGGIYAQALRNLGAEWVLGIDFSVAMVETARERFVGGPFCTS